MFSVETLRYTRRNLPHWEVQGARYFVTVRCAGSVPADVMAQLTAVQCELAAIRAGSSEFSRLQRRYFATVERYLDRATAGVLANAGAAQIVATELGDSGQYGVTIPHFTILPTHWHALIVPDPDGALSLSEVMKRIKGRTGKAIRAVIGGHGPVWQREWFDRWIRDDAEWERCVAYIRNNPVKCGLVRQWQDHPWTR